MTTLSLKFYPDPVLQTVCEPCTLSKEELKEVYYQMYGIMMGNGGVGLAANQAGLTQRLFMMRREDRPADVELVVNPEVMEQGNKSFWSVEGCLSLPNIQVKVKRSDWIRIKYTNLDGKPLEKQVMNQQACIVQHELDHLDGKLLIDHGGSVQRKLLVDKYFKRNR